MLIAPQRVAFLEQLARHLPSGFAVTGDQDGLQILGPQGPVAAIPADWLTADVLLGAQVVQQAVQTLNQIQQEITEATTEPWPARSGAGYAGFPEPRGELVDKELRLWFGAKDTPTLTLSPIPLDSVLLTD